MPWGYAAAAVVGAEVLGGDSGGGGGGGQSATGSQTVVNELPGWARPHAQTALERGAALSETPYQRYDRDRIAGFSPMQLAAQQQAANMQPSAATNQGIGLAGQAGQAAMGQNYQAGNFYGGRFTPMAASQYMSPFIEQSLQPQLREAQRTSDIQATLNASRATQQGAFGGARSGLVEAERQRNLGMQMGDIRAKGLQDAYTQAQNQFNADMGRSMQAQQLGEQSRQYGAGLQLQGLQTGLTAANTLGALGGQQFQQGMDINKLQNAYGGQQQALRQQGLDQAYQDFLNEQNYPYKQLGFYSDLIRGLPLGQTSTKTVYEADPSTAQQLASTGMAMYGLSKYMAEGGMAYADGGSVDAPDNVQRIVSKLSDQQLQQAARAAQIRGDADQLEAIQSEMAMRASERRGLASAVTPQMADRMAGGGVVAFATGGLNDYMKNIVDASSEDIADTPEQRLSGIQGALPGIKALYGESALKPFAEEFKKDRERLGTQRTQNEGLAWLAGSKAVLRPGHKSRAFADAAEAIGMGMAKANKDYDDANSKLRQSEMTLAAAEQARADGQIGKAESLYDKGREDKKEALNRKINANEKLATIQASVDNSIRQTNASMASINKPGETERMLAEVNAIRTGKSSFNGLTGEEGAKAYQDAVGQLGAARYGVKYTGQNKDFEHRKAVLETMQQDQGVKLAQMTVAQYETKGKLNPKEQETLDKAKAFLKNRYDAVSKELQTSGMSSPSTPKLTMSMADVQRTAESSGKTVEEVRAAAAAKGYTITQ